MASYRELLESLHRAPLPTRLHDDLETVLDCLATVPSFGAHDTEVSPWWDTIAANAPASPVETHYVTGSIEAFWSRAHTARVAGKPPLFADAHRLCQYVTSFFNHRPGDPRRTVVVDALDPHGGQLWIDTILPPAFRIETAYLAAQDSADTLAKDRATV
ncbi:hypothetical protein [Actinoalloteichus spitiensis]|uniref:hypothetical protein n=1 Tax=Actinoalloteichus spitiensis TaxID=252394 RepID=UPI00031764F8|nr:hypothetical protein [Actinoalloteichus spitiensis]